MLNYNPIPIRSWAFISPGTNILGFIAQPEEFVNILFCDGSSAIAKRHPTAVGNTGFARLYGEGDAGLRFFSLSSVGLSEIKACWNRAMAESKKGSSYPTLRSFKSDRRKSGLHCHLAMYEIWHGSRPEGYEIHHLNRDKFDWSVDNLLLVRKGREHANADARQKLIESVVHDLHRLSHAYLRHLTLLPGNDFLAEIETLNVEQNLK
jgi:prepilin-type processing-associated H-X9-DG protein